MIAIIESPYKADTDALLRRNQHYAQLISRYMSKKHNCATFASHLLYTQFLHDGDAEERKLGMELGLQMTRTLCEHAPVMWVWGTDYGMSSGMNAALNMANKDYRSYPEKYVQKYQFTMSAFAKDIFEEFAQKDFTNIGAKLSWMDNVISLGIVFSMFDGEYQ